LGGAWLRTATGAFPAGQRPILKALELPETLLISMAETEGVASWLQRLEKYLTAQQGTPGC